MPDFTLSEILLLSPLERRAKRVQFHPRMTVVRGPNSTGKSSLLKSIYWTFGAEPYRVHTSWAQANVTALVRFTLRGEEYAILRKGRFFALFGNNSELLGWYDRVTAGLAPVLGEMLRFRLQLPSQSGELVTPPPAYLFLPFYIDQDGGWTHNWHSFDRLQQLRNWRKSVVEYHTGIKGDDYYTAKARVDALRSEVASVESELRALAGLLQKLRQQAEAVDFDVDLESFREHLEQLLEECRTLQLREEALRDQLTEAHNDQTVLQQQVRIVDAALREVRKDYRYAQDDLLEPEISCPTCGAEYENSFSVRFSIARDEDRLVDLAATLKDKLRDVEERLATVGSNYSRSQQEVVRVQRLLAARQGDVTLETLIHNAGRKEVRKVFRDQIFDSERAILRLTEERKALQKQLRTYDKDTADRRNSILQLYHGSMRSFLRELDIQSQSERSYAAIDARIRDTGSAGPRALLAYFFSILHVMRRYSNVTFCPIVIDSPNQQAPDAVMLPTMLRFIRDNQPDDTQLIIGLEDSHGIDFGGEVVDVATKYRLLSEEEYLEVAGEITPLLDRALQESTSKSGMLDF